MKKLLLSLFLMATMSISALATDIGGKWKGTAEGPNGPIERTFTFKVEGGKLTGETDSQMMGKSVLEGGKVGTVERSPSEVKTTVSPWIAGYR